MGLEADVTPQTKRHELVSSQAQSLTKKYQETKELLKLQELKKRNMQAQLGLTLSHLPITDSYLSDPSHFESPPPKPVLKTVSFFLNDSSEAIQELEDLLIDKTLTMNELATLLRSHSCNQELSKGLYLQKILESWKCQQEMADETVKKTLAKAGESIREYEAQLLTMEDVVETVQRPNLDGLKHPYSPCPKIENHSETNEMTIGMLSQQVELLTCENGALQQRCQEIVNQLTEADREIDRLKAELIGQQGGKQHHLVMEELKLLKAELAENQANAIDREYYERELNEKSLRLHEALVTLEELGCTLKDTEKKLQLKDATLKGLGFNADMEDENLQPEKEQLHELLEASQTKLQETEVKLESTEQHSKELETRNFELIKLGQESERVFSERLAEAQEEIRTLRDKLENQVCRFEETEHVSDCIQTENEQVAKKGLTEQVVGEFESKSEALWQVLEMVDQVDVDVEKMLWDLKSTLFDASKVGPVFVSQKDMMLTVEGEFWSQMLGTFNISSIDRPSLLRSLAKQVIAQEQVKVLTRRICQQAESEVEVADFATLYSWLDNEAHVLILQELKKTLKGKLVSLEQITSRLKLEKDEKLLSLAQASFEFGRQQKHPSEYLRDALKEACLTYVTIRLNVEHDKKQKQLEMQLGNQECTECPRLREVASDLQSKLEDLCSQMFEAGLKIQVKGKAIESVDKMIELQGMVAKHKKELRDIKEAYEQEKEKLRQEVAKANETLRLRSEENIKEIDSLTNCMENLKEKHITERCDLREKFECEMEALCSMINPTNGDGSSSNVSSHTFSAQALSLKERIQELVHQVSVMTEEMRRREAQGDITTLRLKYEKDLENLKVEALLVLAVPHL